MGRPKVEHELMGASKPRALNVLLHIVFFASGIATVLIGQVLPILSADLL